jgi:hypothetical protein
LTHVPLQLLVPDAQLTWHVLPTHTWPALHVSPHPPQLVRSFCRSRHTPPQFVSPVPQLT